MKFNGANPYRIFFTIAVIAALKIETYYSSILSYFHCNPILFVCFVGREDSKIDEFIFSDDSEHTHRQLSSKYSLMKNAFATALGNCSFLVLRFNKYVANVRQKMRQTTNIGWKILQSHVCFISACFLSEIQHSGSLFLSKGNNTHRDPPSLPSFIFSIFLYWLIVYRNRFNRSSFGTGGIVIVLPIQPRGRCEPPLCILSLLRGNDMPTLQSQKASICWEDVHRIPPPLSAS
ncbi:hypothetical protein T06_3848 [Trichinella sp. T6]|nr:hypothetical protein T06_3848 [Trichinella sp. T6]